MKRPLPLRFLPAHLRQSLYFRRYRERYPDWLDLFRAAQLSACPAMAMHNLIPGDEISGSIAFTGFYEWELTQWIVKRAREGGLLVDVGANMGYFALLWAGLSESGRVIAFEPSPRNVGMLTENVRRNHLENRVTIVPKAAGDLNANITFDVGPANQTGWGGIALGEPANRTKVPMVRLDEELAGTNIDVLKIDTEGADPLVLRGCERLLQARLIRHIYFEENTDKLERIGIDRNAAQVFLRSFNYECEPFEGSETEWVAFPA